MIQLDSTEARKFAIHLEGYEGLGTGELVKNGKFEEIGTDVVNNGRFSETGTDVITDGNFDVTGSELITNGDFSAVGGELITNGNFSAGTDLVVDGGFPSPNVNWTFLNATLEIGGVNINNPDAVTNAYISQSISGSPSGKSFVLTYDVLATNGELLQLEQLTSIDLDTSTTGTNRKLYFTWDRADNGLVIKRKSGSVVDITIDNVKLQEVGEGWGVSTGWSIGENKAICDGSTNNSISQSLSLPVGNIKVTFRVEDFTSGQLNLWLDLPTFTQVLSVDANGDYVVYVQTNLGANNIYFYSLAFIGSVTNITVQEVGQDWTVQAGWNIGENKAVCDGSTNNNIGQLFSLPTGSIKVTFEVNSYTSGELALWANLPLFTQIISVNTAGTYEAYFKTTSGANNIYFYSLAFIGSITNVSVQELGADWTQGIGWSIGDSKAISTQALGGELITNGDFANTTAGNIVLNPLFTDTSAEILVNGDFATGLISPWLPTGTINVVADGANYGVQVSGVSSYISQATAAYTLPIILGNSYKFTYRIVSNGGGSLKIAYPDTPLDSSVGTRSVYFVATSTSFIIQTNEASTDVVITDMSVQELGADWTLGGGWSIGEGEAVADGIASTSNMLFQDSGLVVGKNYKISFSSNRVGGTLFVKDGDFYSDTTIYTLNAGTGSAVNTFYITWAGAELGFYAYDYNGSITNVSVELLGEDWTLGGGWSIGEDEAIADGSTSTSNILFQDSGLVVGKTYKISFSSNRVSGTLFVKDGDFYSDNTIYTLISGTGSAVNTFYVTWVGVGGELGFYAYNYNGSITNISVEEIATSYLTQTGVLTADKTWMVIYSAVVSAGTVSATEWGSVISATNTIIDYVKVGATTDFRMVNIGGYFEGSVTGIFAYLVDPLGYWTLQSGWAFSSDRVTYDAVTDIRYISQLLTFELQKSYKIQFTISGGTARLKFTNESDVQLFNNLEKDNYAPDSYILYGTAIASTELRLYAYNTGGGEAFSITDISIQEQDPNDYWTITGNSIWIGNKESVFEDVAQVSNIKNTSFSTITGDDYRMTFKIPAITKGALNWYSSKGLLLNSTPYKAAVDEEILDFIGDGSLGVYAVGGNLDNSFSMTNLSIRLKDTGDVKLTLTNQLTEKVTTVDLTPITYNGRYTEFAYQPIDLIEGMYMIKFTGDSGTYANTLAYITTGTPPLSESEYKAYTTGDDNPDHVYIP
jgi:hypothetical protein